MADLQRLIGVVQAKLDALPEIEVGVLDSYRAHGKAAKAALDELVRDEGARWRESGYEVALTIAGLRTSSTGGPAAAMHNWITAATRKLAKQGAA